MSFRLKTILGIALIEAVLLVVLVWNAMSFLRDSSEEALIARAQTTVSLLATTVANAVLSTDLGFLESYLAEFMRNPGISYVRVKSQDGTLAQAGDPALLRLPFAPTSTVRSLENDVFNIAADIQAGGEVYGTVELGLSVRGIRELLDTAVQRISAIAIIEIVLVGLFSFILGIVLTRQLQALADGARAVAEGGPGFQIPNTSTDEIGQTIGAFNQMSRDLKVSRDEADEAYARIIGAVSDGTLSFNDKGLVDDMNAAAAAMFGLERGHLQDLHITKLLPGVEVRATDDDLVELDANRIDGTSIPVAFTISRVELSRGPVRFTCILRDMTERNAARERLASYAELLEEKNQDLSEFAYVASHDLQEPLRKVISYGDLLVDEYGDALPETGRHYLSRITESTSRMQLLIQDLLAYARVDSRGGALKPVDLEELVSGVLGDLDVAIRESGAEVRVQTLPTLSGEPTQLRQLFQNLIGNALKFQVPGRPPVIDVSCETVALSMAPEMGLEPGVYHCIKVADNGIGFKPEFAAKIFEVFERLHSRSEYSGTGIGLAICKKIAKKYGGTIVASGAEGEGATFSIYFPASARSSTQHNNDQET